MTPEQLQQTLQRSPAFVDPQTGFTLDLSGMDLAGDAMREFLGRAPDGSGDLLAFVHQEMQRIEAGAIKNPDEGRKVTHFSDRLSYPESELFEEIEQFARAMRGNPAIENVVINGIGGSALGPQLLQFAINGPYWNELSSTDRRGWLRVYFVDNTDPAGVADAKAVLDLGKTIVATVSKSGGTQETRNNMLAFEQAYAAAGVPFAPRAVAITMKDSLLWEYAKAHEWAHCFPMAESIGGRTSETNIVGHLPAALTGIDFPAFVSGAARMDVFTRAPSLADNPAYQLATAWHLAGNGRGDRNMVIVPYADRLVLLGKYLQQLVMESLGKELDLDGRVVHQGLTVFGNKGGTDAHAYIQQLNDGRDDFFVTFIEPLRDAEQVAIEDGFSMGDYLHAFKAGLTAALRGKSRQVISMQMDALSEETLGMIIALYERAVAAYAEMIHVNAFHQPGVQAYKLASKAVNAAHQALQQWLQSLDALPFAGAAPAIAEQAGLADQEAAVAGLMAKFAVNDRCFDGKRISRTFVDGTWKYRVSAG